MNKIKQDWFGDVKASQDLSSDYQEITMNQVCLIFYILLGGLLLSCIIYLFEYIYFKLLQYLLRI